MNGLSGFVPYIERPKVVNYAFLYTTGLRIAIAENSASDNWVRTGAATGRAYTSAYSRCSRARTHSGTVI